METAYSVLIIDMFHYDDEHNMAFRGFPSLELAREFARRWVRDSLEELRKAGQTHDELRKQWMIFGEDAVVVGGDYTGYSELDFFIDHPATPDERDWKTIKLQSGVT